MFSSNQTRPPCPAFFSDLFHIAFHPFAKEQAEKRKQRYHFTYPPAKRLPKRNFYGSVKPFGEIYPDPVIVFAS